MKTRIMIFVKNFEKIIGTFPFEQPIINKLLIYFLFKIFLFFLFVFFFVLTTQINTLLVAMKEWTAFPRRRSGGKLLGVSLY
jgi:energy-coupling factor transporter transmembrane protein EcfT